MVNEIGILNVDIIMSQNERIIDYMFECVGRCVRVYPSRPPSLSLSHYHNGLAISIFNPLYLGNDSSNNV